MLKICSHERSGTHWLMANIAHNFRFDIDLSMEAHAGGRRWAENGRTVAIVPWGKLFGTHLPKKEFRHPMAEILYIMRHPLEVMRAVWEFDGKPGTINEYATDGRIQYWRDHVEGYCIECGFVRYEDLLTMPIATIHSIGEMFDLRRKRPEYEIINRRVGWLPLSRMGPREGYRLSTIERFKAILGERYRGYQL